MPPPPDLKLSITAIEVDAAVADDLAVTLSEAAAVHPLQSDLVVGDFTEWAGRALRDRQRFDLVVMNPPYRKINAQSPEREALAAAGVHATNLYVGFVLLGLRLLAPGGQLVAITPRSFTNGTYFRKFRHELLSTAALRRIHVFEHRNKVFADSEVLQENVIFHLEAGGQPGQVVISSSQGYDDPTVEHRVAYEAVISPDDPEQFIHVSTSAEGLKVAEAMAAQPARLEDLELHVSTGRVVDFRSEENLRSKPDSGTVPLLYPTHLRSGRVSWPHPKANFNALANNDDTAGLLLPRGAYVVVTRFSAKEERRRVSAALVLPDDLPGQAVAFENHLNVFHNDDKGLDAELAAGLTAYLNSELVDDYVRLFNGHTQINAGDLRNLRYPSRDELIALGRRVEIRVGV